MGCSPKEIALEVILQRVSSHIDALAGEVHAIEHVIGGELNLMIGRNSQDIARLQRLDYLRQSLEDLAILTLLLSRDTEGSVCSSVESKLRLAASKQMLHGEAFSPQQLPSEEALGEVDLF